MLLAAGLSAAHVVTMGLLKINILVLSCKRPRAKTEGGAMEVGKWCIKALTKDGSAPKHPAMIVVKNLQTGLAHTYRWRVEPGYFPGRCNYCHYITEECICASVKKKMEDMRAQRAKYAIEKKASKAAAIAKRAKDLADGKAAHGAPRDKIEKMARIAQVQKIKPECKGAGLCAWYQVSCCAFPAEKCHAGKHIMLANVSYAASSGAGASSSLGAGAMD